MIYADDVEEISRMALEVALGTDHTYTSDEVAALWDALTDFTLKVGQVSNHPLSYDQIAAMATYIAANAGLVEFLLTQKLESNLAEGLKGFPAWVPGGPLQLAVGRVRQELTVLVESRQAHSYRADGLDELTE